MIHRHHPWTFAALIALALGATLVISPAADAAPVPASPAKPTVETAGWRASTASTVETATAPTPATGQIDGDEVPRFDFNTGQQLPDTPSFRPAADNGYAILSGVRSNAYRYEIRLIASPGIENYRANIRSVMGEINATGSASLTVAAGQFPDPGSSIPANTIYIGASTTSPCGNGGGIAGCGGPYLGLSRAVSTSGAIVMAGRVWLLPPAALQTPLVQHEIIAHEIGHALGLAHYSPSYAGLRQVMYPTISPIPAYRTGDRNGLSYLRGETPRGTVDSAISSAAQSLTVRGWAFDPDQSAASSYSITVDGTVVASGTTNVARPDVNTAYKIGGNRGYVVTVKAATGTRTVCLRVANYPSNAVTSIACKTVSVVGYTPPQGVLDSVIVGSNALGSVNGWAFDPDTMAPLNVTVTIDGKAAFTGVTNVLRSDVNARYGLTGTHGYQFAGRTFPRGTHTVCVTTPDVPTGKVTSLGCKTVTTPAG